MKKYRTVSKVLLLLAVAALAAHAGDGVIEINQAKVLAGAITTGDAEGFPVTNQRAG